MTSNQGWVLELQRGAGNQAIAAMLGPASMRTPVQRAPAESGAVPVREVAAPTVSIARALLAQAEELACGSPPDHASTDIILEGLQDWLDRDASRARREEVFRSLGFARQTAFMATGHSIDAVGSLRRKLALERRDDAGQPMSRPVWQHHRREFDIGAEFLEVLTGERTLEQTVAPAIEQGAMTTIEMGVGAIPVVGALVAIGESMVGYDLSGRRLSRTERALIGGLGLLSELGLVVRGVKAVTNAARLRILSTANVAILRKISLGQATLLVAGARVLTGPERRALRSFARLIRAGNLLTPDQIVTAHRILGKMDEGALIAAARTRNAQQLAQTTGVLLDAGAKPTTVERRVAEILMKHFGAEKVLVLAEVASRPGASAGVRTADYLIGKTLIDTYSPTSGSLKHILQEVGRKHSQAGVIAVDLGTSAATTAQLRPYLARLWGRPESIDITRVLIIEGGSVTADVTRPAVFGASEGLQASGSAARTGTAGTRGSREGQSTEPP